MLIDFLKEPDKSKEKKEGVIRGNTPSLKYLIYKLRQPVPT